MKYQDIYQNKPYKQEENKNKKNEKIGNTSRSSKDISRDLYHTDTTEDLLCTSSATDCTGLIPAGITDEEQLDAYEQLYPYLPIQSGDTPDRENRNRETI